MADGFKGAPKTRDPNYDPATLEYMRTGAHFDEAERVFRQRFIEEYVKDFNGGRAYLRCGRGVDAKTARVKGSLLLCEPYTLLQLERVLKERRATDVVSRNQVLERLWFEANNERNSGKERIAALAHLARCLGMMRDVVMETPTAPQTVMLVPCMSAEGWESAASNAQMALKTRAVNVPMACPPPPPPQPTHGQS